MDLCMCVLWSQRLAEGIISSGAKVRGGCEPPVCMLGTNLDLLSAREASTVNHGAIPPAPLQEFDWLL